MSNAYITIAQVESYFDVRQVAQLSGDTISVAGRFQTGFAQRLRPSARGYRR